MAPIELIREVKRVIYESGLNHNDIAKLSGIPVQTINNLLYRKHAPRIDTVTDILAAVGYELTLRRKE